MTFRGGLETSVGDRRYEASTTTLSADAGFAGGYYRQINTTGPATTVPVEFNASYTPGVGGGLIVRGEIRITSGAVWAPGVTTAQFRICPSGMSSSIQEGDVGMLINGAQQVQPFAYIGGNFYYTAAASYGPTALTDDVIYPMEMKVEVVSTTQLKISVRMRISGTWTLLGSETLTAGTGWATQAWSTAFYGGAFASKGGTGIYDCGGLAVCSLEGAVPNDWFSDLNGWKSELIRPNADVAGEAGWLTGGGATGTYTEWDDAVGAYSTADYNHAGTGAGAETQASDFAATSGTLLSTDTVVAVTVGGAYDSGASWGGNVSIVSDDGTEDAQTPSDLVGRFAQRHFLAGGSGPWTKSSVDGANFKLRTAANATDYRCEAFFAYVWSYTPAASTRRIFLC